MIGQAEPAKILLIATGYEFKVRRGTEKLDKVKNPNAEYILFIKRSKRNVTIATWWVGGRVSKGFL